MVKENFIEWYKDEELMITFSETPDVKMRIIMPFASEEEIEDVNKKPFICLNEITVNIFDYIERTIHTFVIPKGYKWDGASIPRAFWRLVGSPTSPKFLIPSMVHDVLCENHEYIDNNRYLSTIVLERLLYKAHMNAFNRWLVKHSVDNYQKFCGWD